MMDERIAADGRWFQFRLTSLFWLTLVIAAFLAGWLCNNGHTPMLMRQASGTGGQVKIHDLLSVVFPAELLPAALDKKNAGGASAGKLSVVVTDVRSDGSLVLRGSGDLRNVPNRAYYEFSGVTRPDCVRADRSVLSAHIADLRFDMRFHNRF